MPSDNNQQAARELLPCPFCGNANMDEDEGVFRTGHRYDDWVVRCGNPSCGAEVRHESRDVTVAAWNRRPTPPESGEA